MLNEISKKFFRKFFLRRPYLEFDQSVEKIFKNSKKLKIELEKFSINFSLYKDLLNKSSLSNKNLTNNQMIFLSKLFFSQGNIILANKIREKLIKNLININVKNFEFQFLKIKFLIEKNKLNKAIIEIKKKNIFLIRNFINFYHNKNLILFLEKILKKKNIELVNLNPIKFEKKERSFGQFISGKKIIIVGPGFSKKKFGKKIDSFDIVVRFNQFKPISSLQQLYFGSKTHIVYFNGNMTKKININNLNKFLKNKWICSRLNFSDLSNLKNFRSIRKIFINPLGAFGFLQDALIDILHFNPKSIFVTNINFGLGKKLYWSSYSKANKLSNRQMYLSQSKLDLLSSINFIKVLRKNNVIKTDKELAKILELNSKELLLRFKKNNPLDEVVRD